MRTVLVVGLVVGGVACGGAVSAPDRDNRTDDERHFVVASAASLDAADEQETASCWRCTDHAWRNICVVPSERGTDAESCAYCGEHCVSDPVDASAD